MIIILTTCPTTFLACDLWDTMCWMRRAGCDVRESACGMQGVRYDVWVAMCWRRCVGYDV